MEFKPLPKTCLNSRTLFTILLSQSAENLQRFLPSTKFQNIQNQTEKNVFKKIFFVSICVDRVELKEQLIMPNCHAVVHKYFFSNKCANFSIFKITFFIKFY